MVEWVEYFKGLMGRIEKANERDKGGKRREWRVGDRK